MIHVLKTHVRQWVRVRDGKKAFEVRSIRDREFVEGDCVWLVPWDPVADRPPRECALGDDLHSIHVLVAEVGYVLHGYGLPADVVAFQLVGVFMRDFVPAQAIEAERRRAL